MTFYEIVTIALIDILEQSMYSVHQSPHTTHILLFVLQPVFIYLCLSDPYRYLGVQPWFLCLRHISTLLIHGHLKLEFNPML